MLIQAGINGKEKGEFWCEVISMATNLDNIMVIPDRTKPPFTLYCNKDAKCMKYLRSFAEMAVVAILEGKKRRSKLFNRGKTYMFVGYADDHSEDVYGFLNVKTKRIIISRDSRWLNIMWKHYKKEHIMQEDKWNFSWMKKRVRVWKEMNQWRIELRVMGTPHSHREN